MINDQGEIAWTGYDGQYEVYLYSGRNIIKITNNGRKNRLDMINNKGDIVYDTWDGCKGITFNVTIGDNGGTTARINDQDQIIWKNNTVDWKYQIMLYMDGYVKKVSDQTNKGLWNGSLNLNTKETYFGVVMITKGENLLHRIM